jgi:GTP-binding protein
MAYEILRSSTKFQYGMSSPEQLENWLQENPEIFGFSLIGRSNVGKSSTINSLFGNSVARISKTPGRTREINIFTFEISEDGKKVEGLPPLYLFDLPGYGYAEVNRQMSRNWEELMGTFFQSISNDVIMLNIQDARHPNQKADLKFQDYLKNFDFETFLIFNKLDKLKTQKDRAKLNNLKPQLFKQFKWVKQIFFISAEKKQGIQPLESSLINTIFQKLS